jgi:hypothetical protein
MKSSSITTLASLALVSSLSAQGIKTTEQPYLLARSGADFSFEPIVTVGDRLPITPGTAPTGATDFAFCGIPDAMGIYKDRVTGQNILFVAHEVPSNVNTRPFPGLTRYKGAWVSRFVMSNDGGIVNGSVAHKELFLENTQAAGVLGTRPPLEGDAAGFTRFCSGSFAGPEHGMDRPLFLTNEESSTGNYEAQGSQTVVIADGKMYTAPDLGRVARETTMVQPRRDALTVVVSTEDEGAPSYVYMYVGTKQRRSSSVLDKNGLTNGKIYVLAGRDAHHNEGTFTSGSLPTKWVEIPNAATLTSAALAAAADTAGGFGFVRVEDSEFDPTQPTRSMFIATTGSAGPNLLGRLYEVTMNPTNPIANGTINVVFNASNIVNPGGTYNGVVGSLIDPDGAGPMTAPGTLGTYEGGGALGTGTDYPVSIDNIAVSKDFIVCCEDRNAPADAVFGFYARNGGTWTLDRNNNYAAKLQCTFNYAYTQGRDSGVTPTFTGNNTAGRWESSGVIDSSAIFGPGTFVINVQGHLQSSPAWMRSNCPDGLGGVLSKANAAAAYAEDGQVLIMRPIP